MKKLFCAISIGVVLLSQAAIAKINTSEIKDLDAALKTKLPVVLKLGAEWCPPCKKMKPIISELSKEENGKVVFLDIDIEKNRALSGKYQIRLIPTIIIFDKTGKEKFKTEGFMSKEDLLNKLKELKLLK